MKRIVLLVALLTIMVMPTMANDSTYLNFTAVNGTAMVRLAAVGSPNSINLRYSTDNCSTWNTYTIGNAINLASGATVFFKALSTNNLFNDGPSDYYNFQMTGSVAADGNIMSLLDASMWQTSVPDYCFLLLFSGCSSLIKAPSLPALSLGTRCYAYMFDGCSSLSQAPALPAVTLDSACYSWMFQGCTSLTQAPALPAMTMKWACYLDMFNGCTSLAQTPALPATALADSCYANMFDGCSSLQKTPELPAMTLADYCYYNMFKGCTSLTQVPTLPATTLSRTSYDGMFMDCESIIMNISPPGKVWMIPDNGDSIQAYGRDMFLGTGGTFTGSPVMGTDYYQPITCNVVVRSNDSIGGSVTGGGTYIYSQNVTLTAVANENFHFVRWGNGDTSDSTTITVSSDTTLTAIFVANEYAGVPGDSACLNFTAENGPATIKLYEYGTPNPIDLLYSTNNCATWHYYTIGDSINLANGSKVYFKALNINDSFSREFDGYGFWMTGAISADSNLMSLLDASMNTTSVPSYAFCGLFRGCSSLTRAPELSAAAFDSCCYMNMFDGCTSLTYVPALSATTMGYSCCEGMFRGCTALTQTPAVLANTMGDYCCAFMFQNCTALTQASTISADSMGDYCCYQMFKGFTSLKKMSALSANSVGDSCCFEMFKGCSSLTQAPSLPATNLGAGCYNSMFDSCVSLTHAPALPATTMADYCYSKMFSGCTSLLQAPQLPALNLAICCYYSMFDSCISLIQAPPLPATTLANWCYEDMFRNCSSLIQAPALPATNLSYGCYGSMFLGCSSLIVNEQGPGAELTIPYFYFSPHDFSTVTCMFCETGGTMNGTPSQNTTYYFPNGVSRYLVSVDVNDTTMGTVKGSGFYDTGDSVTIIALPIANHRFISWSNGMTNDTITLRVSGDTTLIATFAYNQNYLFENDTTICQGDTCNWRGKAYNTIGVYYDSLKTVYGSDSVYKLNLTVNPTYFFTETHSMNYGDTYNWHNKSLTAAGVYYDSLTTQAGCDSIYELTLTLYKYTVTVNSNDTTMGSVSGGGAFDYGQTATLIAIAKPNYHLVNWSNGAATDTIAIAITGDTTLTATFAIDQHTVTVSSNDTTMGNTAGGGTFNYGDTVTLIATAKPHYHLVNWSNGAITDTITIAITGDTTSTAIFAIDQHTVTVNSNDTTMGYTTGGGTFNYGDTVTLIATANANYHLVNWSNGATTDTITITLTGDTTLTANFAITQYAVTVACNDSSMGYVTGGGAFYYGDTVTMTATAYANYRFVSWNNGALTDTITVIVKGDTTLTANFVVDYGHSVVVNSNDSSADVYFYCQQMYDTIQVREYHLVIYKVGWNDTANVYFSSDTSFVMNRKPRVIVIVDSVSGTTTTVTISINRAAFNPAVNQVAVHLENIAPNSTYSLYLEALGAMRVVLDYDSCTLTTPEFTSVPDVYDDKKVDDFYPTEDTDVYTIDGRYIGKYFLDFPPGIYLMRDKGRWHKFGKVR